MSWISIFAVIFLVLWLRERHLGKQLRQENEDLRRRLGFGESAGAMSDAMSGGAGAQEDTLDNRELEDLRERIQVLERIATDANSAESRKAQAIAAEIESLRGDIAERRAIRNADSNTEDTE
jgi:archaellum component FlaC